MASFLSSQLDTLTDKSFLTWLLVDLLRWWFIIRGKGKTGRAKSEKRESKHLMTPAAPEWHQQVEKEAQEGDGRHPYFIRFRAEVLFTSKDAAAPLWGRLWCAQARRLEHGTTMNFRGDKGVKTDRGTSHETHRLKLSWRSRIYPEEKAHVWPQIWLRAQGLESSMLTLSSLHFTDWKRYHLSDRPSSQGKAGTLFN